jgi:thiol-disulfide isomerase/thioredoxin
VFSFSFPDENGDTLSLEDERFENKAVIIQIMGTWCPNCLDETNFFVEWKTRNRDKPVEIVALAYEKKPDFGYASARVKRMKSKLGIDYPVLIAGINDRELIAESLPQIEQINAYPTTIFLDKTHEIVRIHTGFNGPGTGIHYQNFVEDFNSTVKKLIEN